MFFYKHNDVASCLMTTLPILGGVLSYWVKGQDKTPMKILMKLTLHDIKESGEGKST